MAAKTKRAKKAKDIDDGPEFTSRPVLRPFGKSEIGVKKIRAAVLAVRAERLKKQRKAG